MTVTFVIDPTWARVLFAMLVIDIVLTAVLIGMRIVALRYYRKNTDG